MSSIQNSMYVTSGPNIVDYNSKIGYDPNCFAAHNPYEGSKFAGQLV